MDRLKVSLFVLRLSVAAFFAVWAIEKFVRPEVTAQIFEGFYGISGVGESASYAIGAVQLVVILAFLVWARLRWASVGLLLAMHAVSTLSTWQQLIQPYTGNNHLFWAAVPTLAALVALFILRDEDTLFTLGK